MKFGGSSVGAPDGIARVIEIVRGRLGRKPVVVVSALRGVTDDLLAELAELARGVSLLKELTPRSLDRLAGYGERLSARFFSA